MVRLLTSLLVLLGWALPGQAAETQARLLLAADTVRPGETVLAGLQLRMPAGWHTYWRNAGDSGDRTKIDWTLPPGVTAGEPRWPVPEKYVAEGLTTYVYHGDVVLLVPLTVAPNVPAGPLELKAKVSWLECKEQCLLGRGDVRASLTVGNETKPSAQAELIRAAEKKLPRPEPNLAVKAWWEKAPADDARPLVIEWTPVQAAGGPDFFPYEASAFEVGGDTEVLAASAGKVRVRKTVKRLEGDWPTRLAGLIVGKPRPDALVGYEVDVAIGGAPAGAASVPQEGKAVGGLETVLLLKMLWLAFLGGTILNIMPCVLPVIALKILGFVQQSHEAPARVRKLGILYGLGVLFSFLVMAGLVIAVQSAGRAASWGMQFQNPQFVVVMTVLVTLVALNLFGVFEVTLGGSAMGAAGELAAKEGNAGAFFNGMLATVLATPCTAPVLAIALGFAFAQPPAVIVLMFAVMGLGLAAPYVVLSWFPRWLSVLPKPGPWMVRFKIAMGFPMLAVAFWLLTLTTPHFGSRGPLWVGIFLVTLALAAWLWGEFVQRGRRHKGWAVAFAALFLALGYGYGLEKELRWRSPVALADGNRPWQNHPDGIDWQPWSPAALAQARTEGRPVLVDFTADWCVTCQANKKSSLEIASVRKKIKEVNAVALLGDYTREDPAITEELRRYGRAGVPLVLIYPRDPGQAPEVLPTLLTPGAVLGALERAGKPENVAAR